jgi:hypothetical protein
MMAQAANAGRYRPRRGPAGRSAALFTAKNGLNTFDDDATWLHSAHLFNSLGVGSQDGPAFLETARTRSTASTPSGDRTNP